MKAYLAVLLSTIALAPLASSEIVEEETWYNADGKVVKTVKRTVTGKDARRAPDWEPAWVLRERSRGTKNYVRYSSPRRSYGGYFTGSSYYTPFATGYYTPRRCYGQSGFRGYLRTGGGSTRWGVGYRGNGVSLFLNR